jgi:murein DD-endopeptidase MepM/ murein hydrolase activator NlpD
MASLFGVNAEANIVEDSANSQKMPLLQAAINTDPNPVKTENEPTISGNSLITTAGPTGTVADIKEVPSSDQISTYIVREGDTIASVAKMFGVTSNTVRWANDLGVGSKLKLGDSLVILPISGIQHTVKKGETLKSIATAYKGDIDEIIQYNNLEEGSSLALGDILLIPDGEAIAVVAKPKTVRLGSIGSLGNDNPIIDTSGYFMRPVSGGRKTQGLHGHNGVDLVSSYGAPIMAAASGKVIIAKSGGWNGGYGSYVVISHSNGTQTLYSHLSNVYIGVGSVVSKGQTIGAMGNSGKSTGTHLHFEVRGGRNPF